MVSTAGPIGQFLRTASPALTPALKPALDTAFQTLLTTGSGQQAAVCGVLAFLRAPEGARLATGGATRLLGGVDQVLRSGSQSAPAYAKLLALAGAPSTHRATAAAFKGLGADGEVLSRAVNGVLKAVSKGGLTGGFAKLLKLSPKVLAILGKAANVVPVAGLILSGVMSARTLLDPKSSDAQKAAAVVSLISGVVGTVLPGSGVVTSVVDIGVGLAADGFDAVGKKRG